MLLQNSWNDFGNKYEKVSAHFITIIVTFLNINIDMFVKKCNQMLNKNKNLYNWLKSPKNS